MVLALAVCRKPQDIRLFTRVVFLFLHDTAALLLTSGSLTLLPCNDVATDPAERIRKSHSFTIPYAACIKPIGILGVIPNWKAYIQEADVEMGLSYGKERIPSRR
jgi:hypothetical protein